MSIPVRNNLDLGLNQLLSALAEVLSANPGSGNAEGRLIYNSVSKVLKVYNGTTWTSYYLDTTRLDQIVAPGADVSMNGFKITNLLDPSGAQDAATRGYVDGLIAGLRKSSAVAATTANITLSGAQTIDTVAVVAGNRVLVKNQSTAAQNGVYVAAAGAWTRATDMDSASEVDGAFVIVEDGGQAGTLWVTTSEVTTLGTDAITWTQFNSVADIVAGLGLTKTGTTLDVNVDGSTIEINADTLRIKAGGVTATELADNSVDLSDSDGTVFGTLGLTQGGTGGTSASAARTNLGLARDAQNITGDGVLTSFAVTHSLGTKDITCQVWKVSNDTEVFVEKVRTSVNVVTINFGLPPTNGEVFRVVTQT